jgi:hypothetical protein
MSHKQPSRSETLAGALRDNLHRRKAQARARTAAPDAENPVGGGNASSPEAADSIAPKAGDESVHR